MVGGNKWEGKFSLPFLRSGLTSPPKVMAKDFDEHHWNESRYSPDHPHKSDKIFQLQTERSKCERPGVSISEEDNTLKKYLPVRQGPGNNLWLIRGLYHRTRLDSIQVPTYRFFTLNANTGHNVASEEKKKHLIRHQNCLNNGIQVHCQLPLFRTWRYE
ncbi:unnamed protein product [Nesidiocoris tenuis]|uniref:Uncharacterized protein n=1 Tax=Nesidiocoris tenuis TaxID=355587 RepID=A0A6H5H1M4_9HEMI|nr:unnamed protein product [Nesidiocoris tenuis]